MIAGPRRLLLVTHYFPAHGGGVEAVAYALAERLIERGWEIEWFASDCDRPPLRRGLEARAAGSFNGLERRFGIPYPVWTPVALLGLYRAVRRADAVHLHEGQYLPNLIAALMARTMGRRLVVTQHIGQVPYRNPVPRWLLEVLNRVIARTVLVPADAVIYISHQVMTYFESLVGSRGTFLLVANGVDGRVFRRCEEVAGLAELPRPRLKTAPVLLFVGRFVEKKGLGMIRELARRTPTFQWFLAGSGPIDPATWGLSNVTVLGRLPVSHLVEWYNKADLLVLPSVGEGFPLVVQEAMSCGLPVAVHTETAAAGHLPAGLVLAESVEGADATDRWLARLEFELARPAEDRSALRSLCADFASRHWSWEVSADRHHECLLGAQVTVPQKSSVAISGN